jgi:hypothetical protein
MAAGQNGPPAGNVGVSVIVGGIADRDAPRNTSLKRLIVQKHGTRKKKRKRKKWVQHLYLLIMHSVCV